MKTNVTLSPTELLILQTLLEDAPANRFDRWSVENGEAVTEQYLSNLWDKLQPGVTREY